MSVFFHPLSLHVVESISNPATSVFVHRSVSQVACWVNRSNLLDWRVTALVITMMLVSRLQTFRWHCSWWCDTSRHAWADFSCFVWVGCTALFFSIFCLDFIAKLNMHSLVTRSIFEQALILIENTVLVWKKSWNRFCIAPPQLWNLLQWIFALQAHQRHGTVVALFQDDKINCRFHFQFTFLSKQVHLVQLWCHPGSSLHCRCPLVGTEVLFCLLTQINLTSFLYSYCQPVLKPSVCFRAHWRLDLNLTVYMVDINILHLIAITFNVN